MLEIMSNDDFEPEEGNCLRFIVGTSDMKQKSIFFGCFIVVNRRKILCPFLISSYIETMFSIWLCQEYMGAEEHFLNSFVDLFQH